MPHVAWLNWNFAYMFNSGKQEWLGYHMLKKVWSHVESFWYNTGTWQTDGQTEFLCQYRVSAAIVLLHNKNVHICHLVNVGDFDFLMIVFRHHVGGEDRMWHCFWVFTYLSIDLWWHFDLLPIYRRLISLFWGQPSRHDQFLADR